MRVWQEGSRNRSPTSNSRRPYIRNLHVAFVPHGPSWSLHQGDLSDRLNIFNVPKRSDKERKEDSRGGVCPLPGLVPGKPRSIKNNRKEPDILFRVEMYSTRFSTLYSSRKPLRLLSSSNPNLRSEHDNSSAILRSTGGYLCLQLALVVTALDNT